ncbi:hypothetical protein CORC01_01925 [Colletotrichum orchidophilum]|uniref:Nucleoside phosphorylase domain-containing protein n=1 Tax=Colletotrichum orchidophilum TaxID=1209926 RepID=A0A1G4BN35_9PEZI|nr:uncharacterized protein CORC01_01925 [Colletotrichum orchidophilum]OHF02824.1 hypothetical protein CORC01_01925 [Colletotrichum orchidophilum]
MSAHPPRRRKYFTVAVICALLLEFDTVISNSNELWDGLENNLGKAQGDTNNYTLGGIGRQNAVLVLLPGIRKVNAANTTAKLRSNYGCIRLAVLCGICGSVPNADSEGEVLLGDVILSNSLVQYDLGRLHPHKFETKDAVKNIGQIMQMCSFNPTTLTYIGENLSATAASFTLVKKRRKRHVTNSAVTLAAECLEDASGVREHSLIAFEMEGAGVWVELLCIITKGVHNYADSHNNKAWQHRAAATAAAATRVPVDHYAPAPAQSPVGQARD